MSSVDLCNLESLLSFPKVCAFACVTQLFSVCMSVSVCDICSGCTYGVQESALFSSVSHHFMF